MNKIYNIDFIIEVNKYFIVGGINNRIFIYNNEYEIIKTIKLEENNIVNNICEEKDSFISICLNDRIDYYNLKYFKYYKYFDFKNEKNNLKKNYEIPHNNKNILYLFKIETNKYLICCENETYYHSNLFNQIRKEINTCMEIKPIKSGILINQNYAALKMSDISFKKKSIIYFYQIKSNNIIDKRIEIKEYSFIYSANGLAIIPRKEIEVDNKILLCACKQYLKNQKNGILVVNIEIEKNNKDINFNHIFYETGHFEVYCFCPILKIEKEKFLDNNINIKNTNYFLVGGFDLYKYQGIIKLYKVIFGKKYYDNKIEYIQDIILDKSKIKNKNFEGFKAPIACIIQSKSSEINDILVSCWDGNVYYFSLNIDKYIKYDELYHNSMPFKIFFQSKFSK